MSEQSMQSVDLSPPYRKLVNALLARKRVIPADAASRTAGTSPLQAQLANLQPLLVRSRSESPALPNYLAASRVTEIPRFRGAPNHIIALTPTQLVVSNTSSELIAVDLTTLETNLLPEIEGTHGALCALDDNSFAVANEKELIVSDGDEVTMRLPQSKPVQQILRFAGGGFLASSLTDHTIVSASNEVVHSMQHKGSIRAAVPFDDQHFLLCFDLHVELWNGAEQVGELFRSSEKISAFAANESLVAVRLFNGQVWIGPLSPSKPKVDWVKVCDRSTSVRAVPGGILIPQYFEPMDFVGSDLIKQTTPHTNMNPKVLNDGRLGKLNNTTLEIHDFTPKAA